ncbi:hypothetical protein Hanom_Chr11g01012901 [Helianthus anomalus]
MTLWCICNPTTFQCGGQGFKSRLAWSKMLWVEPSGSSGCGFPLERWRAGSPAPSAFAGVGGLLPLGLPG